MFLFIVHDFVIIDLSYPSKETNREGLEIQTVKLKLIWCILSSLILKLAFHIMLKLLSKLRLKYLFDTYSEASFKCHVTFSCTDTFQALGEAAWNSFV